MRTQLEANELVGADIAGIAIVKRGANRIPFRITKSEDPNMGIDLGKLGRSLFKSDAGKAGVYAAIVRKGADEGPILAALTAAGLDVADRKEDGAIVTFVQKGISDEDVGILKINGDVGLAVTGLSKVTKAFQGYDFESTEFSDVMATGAFFPSVSTAMEMLRMTVGNIMSKADTPAAAATDIGKATEAFATFCTALTAALPVQAFKADNAIRKADAEKVKETKTTEPGKTTETKETTPAPKPEEKPAGTSEEDKEIEKADLSVAPKIGGKPVEGWSTMSDAEKKKWLKDNKANIDPPGKLPEKTQKADGDDVVAKLTDIFTTGMQTLAADFDKKMKPVTEAVETVKTELAAVQAQVKKTDEALNGTTGGALGTGEAPPAREDRLRKSDVSKVPPLLDTAHVGRDGRDAHGRLKAVA